MSSYLTVSAWKVDHFLLCGTPLTLFSWISRSSGFSCLNGWSFSALQVDSFSSPGWGVPQDLVLGLLFSEHVTLMISSSLMTLNTTSCCQLPNLHHMLRPVFWTSGFKHSTQHFTCMSHNSKHSKFKTNFWSSPTKLILHQVGKWQLHS